MFRLIANEIKIDGTSVAINKYIKSLVSVSRKKKSVRKLMIHALHVLSLWFDAMDDILYT